MDDMNTNRTIEILESSMGEGYEAWIMDSPTQCLITRWMLSRFTMRCETSESSALTTTLR